MKLKPERPFGSYSVFGDKNFCRVIGFLTTRTDVKTQGAKLLDGIASLRFLVKCTYFTLQN